MTAKQYLKEHTEKYVMVTYECGEPIFIAPAFQGRVKVTIERSEAEQWTSLDYSNPMKLSYHRAATGYKGLQWEQITQ